MEVKKFVEEYIESERKPWNSIEEWKFIELKINGDQYVYIYWSGKEYNGWITGGVGVPCILKCDGTRRKIQDYNVVWYVTRIFDALEELKQIKDPSPDLSIAIKHLEACLNLSLTLKEGDLATDEEVRAKKKRL